MIGERRVQDGQAIVFDARKDVLTFEAGSKYTLLKILSCNGSYIAPSGKRFWAKHPYQWVTKEEAQYLLGLRGLPSFALADLADAEQHYAY